MIYQIMHKIIPIIHAQITDKEMFASKVENQWIYLQV